jgi:hypothetical protein
MISMVAALALLWPHNDLLFVLLTFHTVTAIPGLNALHPQINPTI